MKTHLFKKGASLLLAAALVTGYAPLGSIASVTQSIAVSASADTVGEDTIEVSTWSEIQAAITRGGSNVKIKVSDSDNWNIDVTQEDNYIDIPSGKTVEIDLNEKHLYRYDNNVSADLAVDNGCIFINNGTLTVKNGYMGYSANTGNGGAVVNNGTMTLENVKIYDGYSSENGGAIYNTGNLVMNGSGVCYSSSVKNGGGVYNTGTLSLNGTEISDNECGSLGGGIYNDGALILDKYVGEYGTEITQIYSNDTDDSESTSGKWRGLYNGASGNIKMKYNTRVNDNNYYDSTLEKNFYQNVFLQDGQTITVSGAFEDRENQNEKLSVTVNDLETRVFTSGFATNNPNADVNDYFDCDEAENNWIISEKNGEVGFERYYWGILVDDIAKIAESESKEGTITLDHDAVWYSFAGSGQDTALNIPSDVTVTIDLNGHKIDRNLNDGIYRYDWEGRSYQDGNVIINNGTLTIKDTSDSQTGMLTGGSAHFSYSDGCCVYNKGTFTLLGGKLTGNRGSYGAVLNEYSAIFNLYGGEISGNYSSQTSQTSGVIQNGTVNVHGSPVVKDNYNLSIEYGYDGQNGLDNEQVTKTISNISSKLNIDGALKDGAELHYTGGLGTFTEGYSTHNGDTDPNTYFKSDRANTTFKIENSEAMLVNTDRLLKGAQLVTGENIKLRASFAASESDDLDVKFEWGSGKEDITDITSNYGGYTADCNLAAKELGDTITYTVMCDVEKEYDYQTYTSTLISYKVLETGTFSVRDNYLLPLLKDGEKEANEQEYTDSTRSFAKALVHYCASAQELFDYKTDNLVNRDITDAASGKAYSLAYTQSDYIDDISTLTSDFTEPESVKFNDDKAELSYYGTSLILNDYLTVRHYFKVTGEFEDNFGYGFYQYEDGSDYYYYDVIVSSPDQLLNKQSAYISYPGSNSWLETIMTVNYSAMDYVYIVMNSSRATTKTRNTAQALYYYAKEAYNFVMS